MKRLALIPAAAAAVALLAVAAPALSLRPYRPAPVEFELAAPAEPAAPGFGRAGAARRGGVVSRPLRTPKRFDLVGLRWRGEAEPAAAIRTRRDGGRWSRWETLGTDAEHAPDAGTGERAAAGTSDPVWAGGADWVQYRLSEPVRGLRLHFVNTTGTATPADKARTAVRRTASRGMAALAALVGIADATAQSAPAIVTREGWGAEDCRPRRSPRYGEVKAAFVHHTVSTNAYTREQAPAAVLAICRYHRNSNGWDDIGYNFLVDRFGTVYEGRAGGIDKAVVGAQTQGFNSETTGIANLGTHTDVPQTGAALDAMARLIRWKLPVHGQPTAGTTTLTSAGGSANRYPSGAGVDFQRVSGHRDAGRTSCPGQALYDQLPALREKVGSAGPRAARTRLEASIGPSRIHYPGQARGQGRLRLASGEPVTGELVELQRLGRSGWRTVERTRTASDGSFEVADAVTRISSFRLRFPGGAALRPSASRAVSVRVRPQVVAERSESRAFVGQTPIISGSVTPRKRSVEVVVQRREGGRNVRVATYRVRARGGRFRKGHRLREPGLYRFYARVRGDSRNLAGWSTPFYVRALPSPAGAGGGVLPVP